MTDDPIRDAQQQKQWAMQWKAASAALQRVRDEELRALGDKPTAEVERVDPHRNGLVEFQRWMMRKAILDAYVNDRAT